MVGDYLSTLVPVERRAEYMDALEVASVQRDIVPFAQFMAGITGGGAGKISICRGIPVCFSDGLSLNWQSM